MYFSDKILSDNLFDVITVFKLHDNIENVEEKIKYIEDAFDSLRTGGLIIFNDKKNFSIDNILISLKKQYKHCQYSSIVATKLDKKRNIPHYSDIIVDELKKENKFRENVINVIQKQ